MRRDLDLAVTALAAIGCAAWTGVPWLRIAAGLVLVLVLPGYALSTLLVPSVRGKVSPLVWRAMWTAGLSLAVAVLGGLLLNLTPAGLTRLTWTISIAALTVLTAGVSAWRRRRSSGFTASVPVRPRVTRLVAAYALAAVVLSGGAIGLAAVSAGRQPATGFAQLWLTSGHGTAPGGQATLGVRSGYHGAQTFHLVLLRGTRAVGTWVFRLGTSHTWQRTVAAPAGQPLIAQLTAGQQTFTVTSS